MAQEWVHERRTPDLQSEPKQGEQAPWQRPACGTAGPRWAEEHLEREWLWKWEISYLGWIDHISRSHKGHGSQGSHHQIGKEQEGTLWCSVGIGGLMWTVVFRRCRNAEMYV